MNWRAIVLIWFSFAACAGLAQTTAKTKNNIGDLDGTLTDANRGTPLVGAGVTVREDASRRFIKSTLSEPTGMYEIDGLTAGTKYFVTFCKQGYFPLTATVTIPTKANGQLRLRQGNLAYWSGDATKFVTGLNGVKNSDGFAMKWQEFERSGISAEGKAYVAREVQNKLQDSPQLWSGVKSFNAYAAADPRKLDLAEQAVWQNSKDPAVANVDPIIAADMLNAKAKLQPVMHNIQPAISDPCSDPYR